MALGTSQAQTPDAKKATSKPKSQERKTEDPKKLIKALLAHRSSLDPKITPADIQATDKGLRDMEDSFPSEYKQVIQKLKTEEPLHLEGVKLSM